MSAPNALGIIAAVVAATVRLAQTAALGITHWRRQP